tara:strand:+ start:3186 stop:3611 length:426 start_codon:yes stop_codon:yes gene_type:complete
MLKKLRLVWFFFKTIFSTSLEDITKIDTEVSQSQRKALSPAEQLKKFLSNYDVTKEDKINYTNTREDHLSNFKHLDKMNDTLTEVVGLLYEEDGKTPKNAAETFDMSYEEYNEYKKKILPLSKERMIKFNDIKAFMAKIRT